MNPAESLPIPAGTGVLPSGDPPAWSFGPAEIEATERRIASRQPGGYRRADRVWLRGEALKQLRAGAGAVR